MIKTYRYNELCNSVSHILTGLGGNTMRFDFTHGNIAGNKYPEVTLRNRYAQDLLEGHEIFKKGKVSLVRSTAEPSDVVDDTPTEKKQETTEEVKNIRTAADVIAYINERFGKDYRTLAKAMNQASKSGIIFPDFNE